MDRVPQEIWEKIFTFACMDNGSTGRSLSLVSRTFNLVSKPVKYHSIALNGLPQILHFAYLIEQTPSHERNVRYLFASNKGWLVSSLANVGSHPPRLSSVWNSVFGCFKTREERKANSEHNTTPKRNVVQEALDADTSQSHESIVHKSIHRVLVAVAPTLRTLSFAFEFDFHEPDIPTLPALEELTFEYDFYWRTHSINIVFKTMKPFPELRRLNIVRLHCHAGPKEVITRAKALAPRLTHIGLPTVQSIGLHNYAEGLVDWIENNAIHDDCDGGADNLLANSPKIFLDSDPWNERDEVFVSRDVWARDLACCRKLAEKNNQIVWRERKMPFNEERKSQEEEWLDRLNGGDGHWHG